MDTETSEVPAPAPRTGKTYLKIPFNGGTIRTLPFESRHAVTLAMVKHVKQDGGKFNILMGLLASVVHDDDYVKVIEALMAKDGAVTEQHVFRIFKDAVDATAKWQADQGETSPGE